MEPLLFWRERERALSSGEGIDSSEFRIQFPCGKVLIVPPSFLPGDFFLVF